jgi:hypothetical protein
MEDSSVSRASAAHAARLDRAVKDLQNRIKEQEATLEEVLALCEENSLITSGANDHLAPSFHRTSS